MQMWTIPARCLVPPFGYRRILAMSLSIRRAPWLRTEPKALFCRRPGDGIRGPGAATGHFPGRSDAYLQRRGWPADSAPPGCTGLAGGLGLLHNDGVETHPGIAIARGGAAAGDYEGWSWTFPLDGGNDGIFCGRAAEAGWRRCG